MSNQYYNFYYSPARQGFDSSAWRALFGLPISSGGRLLMLDTAMIHYGDILRGDATFGVTMAAPAGGLSRKFGFYQPGKNTYAWFNISGATILCETSNGTNTTSTAIDWSSAWTNAVTEFRIKWEAGMVTFYVNGTMLTVTNDVSVVGTPMSIYVANESQDTIFLNYIDVQSIQSYFVNELFENAVFNENYVYEASGLTLTEAVTMFFTILDVNSTSGVFDGPVISEAVTILLLDQKSVSDAIGLTESVTLLRF